MHKKLLIPLVILLFALGAALPFVLLNRNNVGNDLETTGKVTEVINKPNQAEDGAYIIKVSSKGRMYTVNATGYMNTAVSPESQGKTCVNVPKVAKGQTVSFNLPKAIYLQDAFDICHKTNLRGYYFKIT